MEKKKVVIWSIVFAFTLLFVLWPYLFPGRPGSQLISGVPTTMANAATAPVSKPDQTVIAEQDEYLTNPFALRIAVSKRDQAKGEVVAGPAEPELQGIWVSPRTRVAFISGQSVNIGSVVLGWKVTGITKTKVYLSKGGLTKTLELEAQQ